MRRKPSGTRQVITRMVRKTTTLHRGEEKAVANALLNSNKERASLTVQEVVLQSPPKRAKVPGTRRLATSRPLPSTIRPSSEQGAAAMLPQAGQDARLASTLRMACWVWLAVHPGGLRHAAPPAEAPRYQPGPKVDAEGGRVERRVSTWVASHWRRTQSGRTDGRHHPHATLTLRPAHTDTVHVHWHSTLGPSSPPGRALGAGPREDIGIGGVAPAGTGLRTGELIAWDSAHHQ